MAATRLRFSQLFSNSLQLIGVRSSANVHQSQIRQSHICTKQTKSTRLFAEHDSSK